MSIGTCALSGYLSHPQLVLFPALLSVENCVHAVIPSATDRAFVLIDALRCVTGRIAALGWPWQQHLPAKLLSMIGTDFSSCIH